MPGDDIVFGSRTDSAAARAEREADTLPPLPSARNLFAEIGPHQPYDDFQSSVRYVRDEGKLQLPVAYSGVGPRTPGLPGGGARIINNQRIPCQIVQAFAPTSKIIVTWTAGRTGSWPNPPPPIADNPNLVLLSQDYEPLTPQVSGTGNQHLYRISGVYVYAMIAPFVATEDGFAVIGNAMSTTPAFDFGFPPGQFDNALNGGTGLAAGDAEQASRSVGPVQGQIT